MRKDVESGTGSTESGRDTRDNFLHLLLCIQNGFAARNRRPHPRHRSQSTCHRTFRPGHTCKSSWIFVSFTNHQGQPLLELSDGYLKAEQTISKPTAAKDSQVLEACFHLVVAHILLITGLGIGLRTCEVNKVSQQSDPYTACLGVPIVWIFHRIFECLPPRSAILVGGDQREVESCGHGWTRILRHEACFMPEYKRQKCCEKGLLHVLPRVWSKWCI